MTHEATYRTGTRTSALHLRVLNPVLTPVFGTKLFKGSVNLWVDSPLRFESPAEVPAGRGRRWLLVPVVICETAVGVAARRPPPEESDFIEVFSPEELVPKLGLQPEDRVTLRVLDGSHLGL